MKRGTRFFITLAAAVITFASLTVYAGPRYHIGWQYENYYRGGYYHHWYPYRNYWQPPYPPPDSFYTKPPLPQRAY